jgi:Bardet-Biedl syndrome 7 protein
LVYFENDHFYCRRMNTMKITGSFSYAEMHSWIQFCLADVPERPPVDKENRLIYTNIFLQTQLECIYRYLDPLKRLN